jgi:hypothetical protein
MEAARKLTPARSFYSLFPIPCNRVPNHIAGGIPPFSVCNLHTPINLAVFILCNCAPKSCK